MAQQPRYTFHARVADVAVVVQIKSRKASNCPRAIANKFAPDEDRQLLPRCRLCSFLLHTAFGAMDEATSAKALGRASCFPSPLSRKSRSTREQRLLQRLLANSSEPNWEIPFQLKVK
eukprot:CAMPEP_0206496308 /NCGR_PEP_ID=MMETSP0324_2-20121206/49295_1 /ASSEMBLY_ACC=CAM_ASM_000836 /TAXON_ID=2866 /ORGANISM="Crypthecodinium cohnii, Strain Seligo" /LENGTH=117 /DNA_ID=CAMNT_0053981227 /DNA_START=959 /DNA_END=1310 /DNA_ORIENTATION=+